MSRKFRRQRGKVREGIDRRTGKGGGIFLGFKGGKAVMGGGGV